jgi:serine/threonine protein phosphatase PrpC
VHSVSSLPLLGDAAPMNTKWPLQVTMPLLGKDAAADLQDFVFSGADVVPKAAGLRFQVGCYKIPHPRKAESGGEDSLFCVGDAVGVADGVGEWEWRFGLNPRAFADELMEGASAAADITRSNASLAAQERASVLLEEGFKTTKSFGSATALVATLNVAGSELGVANLGDSGLRLIRRMVAPQPTSPRLDDAHPSEHQKQGAFTTGHHVHRRTREQQHAFNCPFQLARLPGPEDFDRLCEQGKTALVRAVQNTPSNRQDGPGHADLYTFPVQEGDLVVLGTDGVFDNLHDREICDLADMAASPFEAPYLVEPNSGKCRKPSDPRSVAEAIAQAAFCRARDGSARTPIGMHAKEAGLYHVGGKMDDITVVAAWVVRGDGAAN